MQTWVVTGPDLPAGGVRVEADTLWLLDGALHVIRDLEVTETFAAGTWLEARDTLHQQDD